MSKTYYTGKQLFNGNSTIHDFAMVVENGTILNIGTQSEVPCPADARHEVLEGWVTPGLLDCHVHLISSDMCGDETPKPHQLQNWSVPAYTMPNSCCRPVWWPAETWAVFAAVPLAFATPFVREWCWVPRY